MSEVIGLGVLLLIVFGIISGYLYKLIRELEKRVKQLEEKKGI